MLSIAQAWMDLAIMPNQDWITSQSSSEQHSVGQDVSVGVGFEVVVVVSPSHEIAHCLSQHFSPEEQSESVLQSEHWQSVLVSHSVSPGQLFAAQVSSQLWQPTLL